METMVARQDKVSTVTDHVRGDNCNVSSNDRNVPGGKQTEKSKEISSFGQETSFGEDGGTNKSSSGGGFGGLLGGGESGGGGMVKSSSFGSSYDYFSKSSTGTFGGDGMGGLRGGNKSLSSFGSAAGGGEGLGGLEEVVAQTRQLR